VNHTANAMPTPASTTATSNLARRRPYIDATLRRLLHEDSGQDMMEYALVAALVGLGVLGAMKGLKNSVGNSFNGVGTELGNA